MKVRISRFLVMLSGAIVFFALVFRVGLGFGPESRTGCVLAMTLCAFSGVLWLGGLARLKHASEQAFADVMCSGTWVRLRTVVVGAAVVGFVIEQELAWFFGWTVFFYMVVLATETALVVWLFKEYDRKRDIVKNDGSKFYPGASLASR